MTKVYDLYEFGEHIATGSVVELAEVTELSTPRLYQIASSGNPKYTLTHIGNYKAVYALYEHDVYKTSGTIEQLSKATGKKEANLIWMSNSASLNRNPSTILVRIEGEQELVKKKSLILKQSLYKLSRDGMTLRGTLSELAETFNMLPKSVQNAAIKIGVRHVKVKCVSKGNLEEFYGTVPEIAKWTGLSVSRIINVLRDNGETKRYTIEDTGEYIDEMFEVKAPNQVKPTVRTPQRTPVTPMSDYALELLEWSTRHLRRDA